MGLVLIFITSCNKETNPTDIIPVLTTTTPTEITHNTVICGGSITSDGGSSVTSRGVCWSTSPNPTTADSKTTDAAGTGSFTSSITGLTQATTYYIRAYATNKGGTAYGFQLSFTTLIVVTDIDGNVYHIVKIGTQTWMVENLKTTKYRNGVSIPNVTDATAWINQRSGAYCDYNNNPSNSITYGKLYNWYAISDIRNIAPTGWHIPTDAEWTILTDYLGGEAGGKLKEAGNAHWANPNTGATNETGFSALPGGYRFGGGQGSGLLFYYLGESGFWWSTTKYRGLDHNTSSLVNNTLQGYSSNGLSVRCLKD